MIELASRDEIVIRLALVSDVVPGITEKLRNQFYRLGHLVAIIIGLIASTFSRRGLTSVIVDTEGGLIHTADHG